MGGLLIIFSISLSTFLWARLGGALIWLALFVLLFYGLIGSYDDYRKIKKKNSKGLSARGKLACQILGRLWSDCTSIPSRFQRTSECPVFKNMNPDLGWMYVVFAIVVIIGASNAVNLTDGLDGLAAGPTVITAAVYLIFSYLAGNAMLSEYLQSPMCPEAENWRFSAAALSAAVSGFYGLTPTRRRSSWEMWGLLRWAVAGGGGDHHQAGDTADHRRRHFCDGGHLGNHAGRVL